MRIEGVGEQEIAASPERCFEILTDYAAYPEWWPGCKSCKVVAGAPPASGHEVELIFDTKTPVGDVDCRLRFDVDPPTHIRPNRVDGRLKKLAGEGWTLLPVNRGTRARYEVSAEMDTGMPGMLERPFRGQARHFLVEAPVEALKRRVEGR